MTLVGPMFDFLLGDDKQVFISKESRKKFVGKYTEKKLIFMLKFNFIDYDNYSWYSLLVQYEN